MKATTTTPEVNKVSKVPANNTNPLAGIGGLKPIRTANKAQAIADKAIINIAKATTKEAKDKAIQEGGKAIADAILTESKPAKKPAKAVAKPKEVKEPLFTCVEAMGIIIKANPKATPEVIINKADTLYIKRTGKESNIFQMGKYYRFASQFLRGYNA